jgi:SAM-dependent methyltransferase
MRNLTLAQIKNRSRPVIPARTAPRTKHPNESALNRLSHQQLADALYFVASHHASGRLLDIGCGRKPYRDLLSPFVTQHVGVDHPDSPHSLDAADVLAAAYDIPLESASFQTVLMTEVLEHLEEPEAALREVHRLLCPGGKVILTTPFMWVLHEEPRDFFRYTPFGLHHLLSEAGFVDIVVWPISGQWATIALLFGYALRRYRRGPLRPPIDLVAVTLQAIATRLDALHFKPEGTYDHIAVATKPQG